MNLKTRTFSDLPSLNVKRHWLATAIVDDFIFVFVGKDQNDRILKSVEFYDPAKKKWLMANPMIAGRWDHVAVVLKGSIHIVGGQGLQFIETYDWERNVWNKGSPMNSERHGLGAVVNIGKIYASGEVI